MRLATLCAVAAALAAGAPAAARDYTGKQLLADCRDGWSGPCGTMYMSHKTRTAIGATRQSAGAPQACMGLPSSTSTAEQRRFQRAAVRWLERDPRRLDSPARELIPEIAAEAFPCR